MSGVSVCPCSRPSRFQSVSPCRNRNRRRSPSFAQDRLVYFYYIAAEGSGVDTLVSARMDDDWTVVTADGSWAAHFEHTVAVTADGPWVLTAEDGGESRLGHTRNKDPEGVPST